MIVVNMATLRIPCTWILWAIRATVQGSHIYGTCSASTRGAAIIRVLDAWTRLAAALSNPKRPTDPEGPFRLPIRN